MTINAKKFLQMPHAAAIILAATLAAFAFVFIMQYGFDFHPCILCLWQRVPVGIAAVASLAALIWKPHGKHTRILLGLCALAFLAGFGLAVFHTGVERHWWIGTAGCAIEPLHATNPESLREELLHTVVARCDEISWSFLSLSMANDNIAFFVADGGVRNLCRAQEIAQILNLHIKGMDH